MYARHALARPRRATTTTPWNGGTTIFEWRFLGKHFDEMSFRCRQDLDGQAPATPAFWPR